MALPFRLYLLTLGCGLAVTLAVVALATALGAEMWLAGPASLFVATVAVWPLVKRLSPAYGPFWEWVLTNGAAWGTIAVVLYFFSDVLFVTTSLLAGL